MTEIINNKSTYLLHVIYATAFILSIIISGFDETEVPNELPIYNIAKIIITIICLMLFLCKIFMDNNSNLFNIISTFIILLSIIVGIHSRLILLPIIISMIIASKNIAYEKIVKYFFITVLSIFSTVIVLFLLHILPNIQRLRNNGEIRNSFGFNYPLAFSSFILSLCIAYCILRYKNISWIDIIIITIISYINYYLSISEMNFYSSLILICILIIWKVKRSLLHKFPFSISWMGLIIMTVLTLYFSITFNVLNTFSYNLNKTLENRIYFSNYALNRFHISLLGHIIKENPIGTNIYGTKENSLMPFYIDQSMMRLLLKYGLIIFLLAVILYTFKMFKLHMQSMDYLVLLFLVLIICGFSDNKLFRMCYDPFLPILLSNLDYFKIKYKK